MQILKPLYGLKQATRKCCEKLTRVLLSQGYKQSTYEHSLFTFTKESCFTILLVYVYDMVISGNSHDDFEVITQVLNDKFKIKDLGQLKYFLGIEVAHSQEPKLLSHLLIFQQSYIKTLPICLKILLTIEGLQADFYT